MVTISSKYIYRFALFLFILSLMAMLFSSCGGSHWGTRAGVDVVWGPGGPRVQPELSVGLYNGGRW
ncbi:hypothetical protein [Robertkochia aurantiaca]|uniref:hypothetical protein n=1 Tax=Robertkochia aurantiaca TaxID=2873700 RepID=UPI001CCE30DB|nr:hypothetical protein [Robertkochia sp. 3YJGBD-33]